MVNELLTPLIPVAAGGILALMGVAIGPFIAHKLSYAKDRRRERVQKFEELYILVATHERWVEQERLRVVFHHKIDAQTNPLYRAQAICALYFPQLTDHIEELSHTTQPYILWMAEAGVSRLKGTLTAENGFKDAYAPYRRKFTDTLAHLDRYATEKGDKI